MPIEKAPVCILSRFVKPIAVRRATMAVVLLVGLVLGTTCNARSIKPDFVVEPAPRWVKPVQPEVTPAASVTDDQSTAGIVYLLYDNQIRLDGPERTAFRHFAMQATNEKGLETVANIEIRFDPTYQLLRLHDVQVIRHGVRSNRLSVGAVKLLQREKDLEYLVYDGSKTASIFLDDVQVGDVVEYSFSVRGSNPVFGGHHAGRFDLQWSAPIRQGYAALDVAQDRKVAVKLLNKAPEPLVQTVGGRRIFSWTRRGVAPLSIESDAPGWYDPYPAVEWSEYADWGAVAKWAVPLYADVPSAAVTTVAARLRQESSSPETQVMNALRFVQRDIRYLSVAVGAGSHAPRPAATVLERRFGDCKDKSRLLVSLLRSMGVDAHAALVHSQSERGVEAGAPSPYAFNHVIVRVRVGNRTYWLDPTRSPQGGNLATVHQRDFGVALVVADETTGLEQMFPDKQALPPSKRTIASVIDTRQGMEQAASYSVTTTYEGGAADDVRASLAANRPDQLEKQYLTFYEGYFPVVKVKEKLRVEDDIAANRVVTYETYELPQFWSVSQDKRKWEGVLRVPEIESLLQSPHVKTRASPVAIAYPLDVVVTTEVLLPEPWTIHPRQSTVVAPSATISRQVDMPARDHLRLRDRYLSTAQFVGANELAKYLSDLGAARDNANMLLSVPVKGGPSTDWWEQMNGLIAMLAVAFVAGWAWVARRLYRIDPRPDGRPADHSLVGLNGWLALLGLGILATPVRIGYALWTNAPAYALDSWAALTTRTSDAYHPLWTPLLIGELAFNLGLLVLSLTMLMLYIRRRSLFPRFYIGFSIFAIVGQAVDLGLLGLIPSSSGANHSKEWAETIRSLIALAIWGSYVLTSVRVRSTMINLASARPVRLAALIVQPSNTAGAAPRSDLPSKTTDQSAMDSR